MKKQYTFYTDPGHGWMKVHVDEVHTLGIKNDISYYSYLKGNFAYLEEDCDAGVFLDAAKKAGWDVKIQTHPKDNHEGIRNLCPYRPSLI